MKNLVPISFIVLLACSFSRSARFCFPCFYSSMFLFFCPEEMN